MLFDFYYAHSVKSFNRKRRHIGKYPDNLLSDIRILSVLRN